MYNASFMCSILSALFKACWFTNFAKTCCACIVRRSCWDVYRASVLVLQMPQYRRKLPVVYKADCGLCFWERLWRPEEPTVVVADCCGWPRVSWTLGICSSVGQEARQEVKVMFGNLVYCSSASDYYFDFTKRLSTVVCYCVYVCYLLGTAEKQFVTDAVFH